MYRLLRPPLINRVQKSNTPDESCSSATVESALPSLHSRGRYIHPSCARPLGGPANRCESMAKCPAVDVKPSLRNLFHNSLHLRSERGLAPPVGERQVTERCSRNSGQSQSHGQVSMKVGIRNVLDESELSKAKWSTRSATDVPSAERLNQRTHIASLDPDDRLGKLWQHGPSRRGPHVTASTIVEESKLVNMAADHEWAISVTKQFPPAVDVLTMARTGTPARPPARSRSPSAACG